MVLTAQVIERCNAKGSLGIDVTPLAKCVRKLEEVAARYSGRGLLSRMANFRRDGDDIQRLRNRIRDLVPIIGLAATAQVSDQLKNVQNMLVRCWLGVGTSWIYSEARCVIIGFCAVWMMVKVLLRAVFTLYRNFFKESRGHETTGCYHKQSGLPTSIRVYSLSFVD